MDLLRELPFYSETLVIKLNCFKESSAAAITDQVFADIVELGAEEVIFLMNDFCDVDIFFMVKKEVQRRIALDKETPELVMNNIFIEENKQDILENIWPRNWKTMVDLDRCGADKSSLSAFFEKVCFLPNLESLIVNTIYKEIPNYFGRLKKLKVLHLRLRNLKRLPPTMRFCANLEELKLDLNEFNYLPFWITKLKKLNKIWRHCNSLQIDGSGKPERIHIKAGQGEYTKSLEKPEAKQNNPSSLFVLSSAAALRSLPCLISDDLPCDVLPKTVVDSLLDMSLDLKFCDICLRAFLDNEYFLVRKTFADFIGNKYVPFEAVACSEACADTIYEEFLALAAKEDFCLRQTFVYDVPGSVRFKCRCRNCRPVRFGFLKKLICCS